LIRQIRVIRGCPLLLFWIAGEAYAVFFFETTITFCTVVFPKSETVIVLTECQSAKKRGKEVSLR